VLDVTTFPDEMAEDDWRVFHELILPPILAGALEAFEEHGYHGTTVRDIARRVGVTVPALYYHYENKQAMLVELLMGSMGALLKRCRTAVAGADDDPVSRFRVLVECIVLFMGHRTTRGVLESEIRSLVPNNRVRYIALRDELEGMLHDIVADGVKAGQFDTEYPVEAGRAVLTMCNAVGRWYHPHGLMPPAELASRYVSVALGAVGYRPSGRRKTRAAAKPARKVGVGSR
jgi:AcrR family transcriptional regulator